MVDDYEPMVAQKVSLRQYSVRGGSAYVVHCGHGGTCNTLTEAFFKKRSDWYSPEVFCGEVPRWLSDGRAP